MGKVEFENIQFLSGFQTTVDCAPLFLLASKAITLILSRDRSSLIPSFIWVVTQGLSPTYDCGGEALCDYPKTAAKETTIGQTVHSFSIFQRTRKKVCEVNAKHAGVVAYAAATRVTKSPI